MDTYSPLSCIADHKYAELLADAKSAFHHSLERSDAIVRDHPRQSLAAAAAIGAIARSLPLPALIAGSVRLILFAAPPALAVVGAAAVFEHLRRRDEMIRNATHPPVSPTEHSPAARPGILARVFGRRYRARR